MTIESCPHNEGRMGMCEMCIAEVRPSKDDREQRAQDLEQAAKLLEKWGLTRLVWDVRQLK